LTKFQIQIQNPIWSVII